jgi:hypothetical protein
MVSDAILFYEQHGPSSKTGLTRELSKREKMIRDLGTICSNLNARIRALEESEPTFAIDEATGLFHLKLD